MVSTEEVMKQDMLALEKVIKYNFKNPKYIEEALTHSSYANEKNNKNIRHNERMEFLGDAVLGVVVSDYLFMKYPDLPEGELTKLRSKVVCEATLADCARKIELGDHIYFGRGEEMTGGRERASILADAYEAVIAAIYQDGGLEHARGFILEHMMTKVSDAMAGRIFVDYKTRLQEVVQAKKITKIKYVVVGEEGPDHSKTFFTEVHINDKMIGKGQGHSKKEAEQNAAQMALERIDEI